jgi:hypothetical protein
LEERKKSWGEDSEEDHREEGHREGKPDGTVAGSHHQHDAIKHRHKHYHVTHYLHRSENWGHLLSTHMHEHNHAELEHVHIPHTDVEKEHRREAHIHDRAPS